MTDPFGAPSVRVDAASVRRLVAFLRNAFIVVFGLFIAVPAAGRFAVDWLWAREVRYEQVFLTSLGWQAGLFVFQGTVAFLFVFLNLRRAAPRSTKELTVFSSGFGVEQAVVTRIVPLIVLAFSGIVALATAFAASERWLGYMLAARAVPTGEASPLFGHDMAFYLFQLPALTMALGTAVAITAIVTLATAFLYALKGELSILPRSGASSSPASWHVAALAALFFVLTAVQLVVVTRAELAFSMTGPLVGASWTDVNVRLAGIIAGAVAALGAAGWVLRGAGKREVLRHAGMAVAVYAGVTLLGRGIAPAIAQRLIVLPNELSREQPYLERHIAASRRAWGLDSVVLRELSGDAQLSMADIRANAPTITNIRLWERDLLGQTLGQLQEIRTYYDFVSVYDDRYVIDGVYRQVHLSARELNSTSLPTAGFINERLTFTHGMGLAMAPVNEVTPEGLPVLFVKDLPPVSTTSLKLTRPEIYYGELTNSHVFVGTAQKEFDYPAGDANIYSKYEGAGGIPMGSTARKTLFSWYLNSLKIMLSSDLGDSTRVLMRRNIRERASTALPFLQYDPEAYLVVTDSGRLVWVLDAYTTSRYYPYSARLANGTNYMRNSVKVTVDAYDGSVTAYLADANDPIAQAYGRMFRDVFLPLEAMPADLRRHLRYPNSLFRAQALLLGTFHMKEPDAFYHREDQWQIPEGSQRDRQVSPYMRHMIMRLPGEKDAEFIYMTPFTPRGKDNLAAWLVARMDGDHYGKLLVYRFPKQSLVYGPRQIVNRIEQDTEISRQLSLWDQRGSNAIRGELLVIPIEESLIYVQPIYLQAEGGSIPELKRVVVAHGSRVAMGETLEQGLAMVFGSDGGRLTPVPARSTSGTATAATSGQPALESLLTRSQQHYDRAIAAQRAGNWAEYGREIEQLGAVLRELRGLQRPR